MRSFRCLVLVALCVPAASLQLGEAAREQEHSMLAAWSKELDEQPAEKKGKPPSPIDRVVALLNEMKESLEKEAEEDQVQYDKMKCWCITNEEEKTKAIADGEAKDKELTSEIEERAARGAELETEIEHLGTQIAEETKALADATALREKEYGEFTTEEKDAVQAVTMLKNAIAVLSKHNEGLLQLTPGMVESLGSVLQWASLKHMEMVAANKAGMTSTGVSLLEWAHKVQTVSQSKESEKEDSVMQDLSRALDEIDSKPSLVPIEFAAQLIARQAASGPALVQQSKKQPVAVKSYNPASGKIFGILNQMKEEFESNLSTSQKEEVKAQEEYAELKATKEELLESMKKSKEEKSGEMWDNKKALTDAKEDLESTRATLKEDKQFLMDLKLTCQKIDKEWTVRSKSRSEEIKAVAEAIAILRSDDARDLLSKTVTFLQVGTVRTHSGASEKALRSRAADVLRAAAASMLPYMDDLLPMWGGQARPDTQLSAITMSVKLDAFTKVKEAMDKMIAELKAQQAEEVKKKEFCNTEFNQNEKQTYVTNEELEDLNTEIKALEATIETLTAEIEAAKEEIADTEVSIKQAGEQRKKENQDYQVVVADQRATQNILAKAKERLEQFYGKKTFLLQQPAPPGGGFKPMKKNAGASPVISMLEQIIEESVAVEKEAIEAENEAQSDYAEFVKDTAASIQALNDAIVAKTDNIAAAEVEKENKEMAAKAAQEKLESLAAYKADLHEDCDFILKNFDLRQQARLKEIEAIQEAKAILSGMK